VLLKLLDRGVRHVEEHVPGVCRDGRDARDELAVEEVELEQDALILDGGVERQGTVGERRQVRACLGEGDSVGEQHGGSLP